MQRVVVTGMGIQSCIGTDLATVKESLYHTKSGITANAEYAERGMRSQVSGSLELQSDRIDRKLMRFMGNAAAFAYLSAVDA
ncbi:MAG: beta-ketoacyl synthase N-terminal-like domain-containing protein, partial [Litorivicinus sp.]